MSTIRAVYENGVFRPVAPVELPEHCEVEFEPRRIAEGDLERQAMRRVFDTMSKRYASGHRDTAERHNEHQP